MPIASENQRKLEKSESETLKEESGHIIEEARMILPGIQALFGFQMVAVFNQRFVELPSIGTHAHLIAVVLIALAIALIMAPASYHRLAEPGQSSRRLISITSGLICAAMIPLMLGLTFDLFVVFLLVTKNDRVSAIIASTVLVVIFSLWFVLPLYVRNKRMNIKNFH